MNRLKEHPMITAVKETIGRVRNGASPYDTGPYETADMMRVADTFTEQIQHDHFVNGLQERVSNGQDVSEWIKGYLSVVFAQGFSAGSRYETLKELEK